MAQGNGVADGGPGDPGGGGGGGAPHLLGPGGGGSGGGGKQPPPHSHLDNVLGNCGDERCEGAGALLAWAPAPASAFWLG